MAYEIMTKQSTVSSLEQAQKLKEYSQRGKLMAALTGEILTARKTVSVQITLKSRRLSQYFPKTTSGSKWKEVIFSLLETWKSQQEGALPNDSDG